MQAWRAGFYFTNKKFVAFARNYTENPLFGKDSASTVFPFWIYSFITHYSQNFPTLILWKEKSKFLGFHAVVVVKTFPLMYQLLM